MMGKAQDPLEPWRKSPPDGDKPEARAAGLFRQAMVPGEPDGAGLARIGALLAARDGDSRHRSPARRQGAPVRARLAFRVALVSLFLLAGIASVKAYEFLWKSGWLQRQTATVPQPAHPGAIHRSGKPSVAPTPDHPLVPMHEPAVMPAPPMVPATKAKAAAPLTRLARQQPSASSRESAPAAGQMNRQTNERVPVVSPDPSPPRHPGDSIPMPSAPRAQTHGPRALPSSATNASSSAGNSVADEVAALDRALGLLRRDRDAEGALAALDAYLVAYPNGTLRREASFGRLDALLLLHREDQALAALESLTLDRGRRGAELQVIRGELRARKSCPAAIADFSQVLDRNPDAALLERILYGRASCRTSTGDSAGAAVDVQRYLDRFPEGPHASWARRWIGENRKHITGAR